MDTGLVVGGGGSMALALYHPLSLSLTLFVQQCLMLILTGVVIYIVNCIINI